MLSKRMRTLALVAIGALAGCPGDCDVVPMADVCVTLGFDAVQETFVCPAGTGGADNQCTFVVQSSNGGILVLSPSVVVVPEGRADTIVFDTIGNTTGVVTITALTEDGRTLVLGDAEVSNFCP